MKRMEIRIFVRDSLKEESESWRRIGVEKAQDIVYHHHNKFSPYVRFMLVEERTCLFGTTLMFMDALYR